MHLQSQQQSRPRPAHSHPPSAPQQPPQPHTHVRITFHAHDPFTNSTEKDSAASRPPFTRVEVLSDGSMRFFYPNDTTTTFRASRPEMSHTATQQSSERPQQPPFTPFGIPAQFTQARRNEICLPFINPMSRCPFGVKCRRIHPHDRETYQQKMWDALAIPTAAKSSQEKEKVSERKGRDVTSEVMSMDAESDVNKVPPDKQVIGLTYWEEGWGTDGSWMGVSKAESWTSVATTSPATSNDRLSSVSSGSSSPTSVSPNLTDDDKEEDLVPRPVPIRARGNAICVMYKKGGKCPRGKDCIFKHVQDVVVPPSESLGANSPLASTSVSIPAPRPSTPSMKILTSSTLTPSTKSSPSTKSTHSTKPTPSTKSTVSLVTPSPARIPAPPGMITSKKTPVTSVASSCVKTPVSSVVTPPSKASVSSSPVTPVESTTPLAPVRLSSRSTPPQPRIGHPRPRSNLTCHRWLRGLCPYGYDCRFVHGDLKYDDESLKVNLPPPIPNDDFLLSVTLHQYMRVQCSAGFDIQRIQTAFESSTLLVSNISPRVRPNHLRENLSSYGIVEEIWMPSSFSAGTVVKVIYSDTAEAQKAQNALNGTKMYDLTITAKVANSGNVTTVTNALLKDTAIRISFEAPSKKVYAGYSNQEDAERAIQIARDGPLNGHYLKGEIYEGMPAVDVVNVRFSGVPLDVDKADLVRFVNPVDFMWTRPNYEGLEDVFRCLKFRLRDYSPEIVEFLPPPYRDGGMVRAWVNFPNPSKAKEAARRLDGWMPDWTGHTPIRATHVKSLSYGVLQEKWDKAGAGIDMLQASYRRKLASVSVSIRDAGGRWVRLSGDDQKELAHLKNQFEQILKGEIVRCDGKEVYDSYFTTREGEEFLRDLSTKNPSVYYECHAQRCHIVLYGYVVNRTRFGNAIIAKVKEIRSQKKYEIPLPGRLYGAALNDRGLRDMRKRHGSDNAYLDVQRRVLYVRGSSGLYEKFKRMVGEIEERIPKGVRYEGPVCPICFDEPSSPIRLHCGDVWCRGCIGDYFQSAREQKTFPLKCLGKEGRCGTKISISAAKQVMTRGELEKVVGAAFQSYVNEHAKEYRYCLTPDCPQIYRCTAQKGTLQCPMCLSSICTRCHREAHDEMECPDQVQDDLFKKWIREHDVKQCPTCDVQIERIEGCHHMTCTRCQTHICWQCLKTFPRGEGIYGHMREAHGTFGLGAGFD